MSARERFEDALRDRGHIIKGNSAQCPAHPDSSPSLSIGDRRNGDGIVVYCHAGCTTPDILTALGLSMGDLFDDDEIRGIYASKRDYPYPDGRVLNREPGKRFRQSGNTKGNSLFHADRIGDAQTVYWPEGEKDAEAIEAAGGVAVCSAMGAGKAHLADVSPLRGKHVIVIEDKDKPGRQHAQQVAKIWPASPDRCASWKPLPVRTSLITSPPTRGSTSWCRSRTQPKSPCSPTCYSPARRCANCPNPNR